MASITNQAAGPAVEDMAITNLPLPLTVVEESGDPPRCVAYWDLKREDCGRLYPSGRARSQAFRLAGGWKGLFFLSARCDTDQRGAFRCFGLFLEMQQEEEGEGSGSGVTVEYEFAARTRQSGEFVRRYKDYYTFTGGRAIGYRNLFAVPWPAFMADDSLFFVDGVLHLRAELSVKQPGLDQ